MKTFEITSTIIICATNIEEAQARIYKNKEEEIAYELLRNCDIQELGEIEDEPIQEKDVIRNNNGEEVEQ